MATVTDMPGFRALLSLVNLQEDRDPTDIFSRWHLGPDDLLIAKAVAEKLHRVWASWTVDQRLILLDAAEAVAHAHAVRKDWRQSHQEKARYRTLAAHCCDAARLANSLANTFPPPWRESRQPIGQLIQQLTDFASSGLEETAVLDHQLAIRLAQHRLKRLRAETPRQAAKASFELVGELAGLAGAVAGKPPLNETTIRRLLQDDKHRRPPGVDVWRKSWGALVRSLRALEGAGVSVNHRFLRLLANYLRGTATD